MDQFSDLELGLDNLELDGPTAKEIRYGKTILPIWHNVDRDLVLDCLPVLAGGLRF